MRLDSKGNCGVFDDTNCLIYFRLIVATPYLVGVYLVLLQIMEDYTHYLLIIFKFQKELKLFVFQFFKEY